MNSRLLADNVHYIGVNDRETALFESLIPIPEGVSYNSYLIDDDKVALIDTVKIDFNDTYMSKIKRIIGERQVDYLIINHMEPDHAGCIQTLVEAYPNIQIVGNKKTASFLQGFYGVSEQVVLVQEQDTIDLGKHQLSFYITPMLHWPETMMTYEKNQKILFSGDAFGGFGTLNGGIFDDQLPFSYYENEMRRYYANIVGRYSDMVQRALQRLSELEIKQIAATHGIIWRQNPQTVLELYDRWSKQETELGAVIAYGSMYGNTKAMAESLATLLSESGIEQIRIYDAARADVSYIMSDIWKYNIVLLGSSTYNGGLFPPMTKLLAKIENSKMKNRYYGAFGSYSWSGESVKLLKEAGERGKMDFVEPVVQVMFAPNDDTYQSSKQLVNNIIDQLNK